MIEKRLVRNNLKKNKFRNICAIIAIVLTSILFTSVFSVFFLLRDGFSEVEARKNGWTGHAVITGVTQKQFDSLKNNSLVEQISYYIHYGFILDKKKNLGVELRYDQKQMLDWNFFDIIEGKIPQKRNEILVSKDFFKRENIKYGINQKVELAYWINGSTYKQKFYISGIYSKCEVQKECVFISKELSNELSKKLKEQSDMNDSAAGLGAVEVKFQNTHHLQEDLTSLINQSTCDKQKNHYDINPIYESSDNSMKSEIIILCVLLVVVGFIGYLIIYNVFYISIRNDTRYYGLLRTLGFSKGEIKRLIRNEIYAISLIAIPLGVVLGYVISEVLLPKILALFQLSVKMNGFSIYIFIY
ncbi:ABC transporter, ATP-binding protein [Lachnospiraceae bacterium KM106-2]|nr:ABC transporter, ATP-binding protein [Lachnospiraceae bacterium KM106-2]